jgi:acetyltransferase-like isoleucine patch superfamily enzyme
MDIHPKAVVSLGARLDKTHPRGVHLGQGTYVASDAAILTNDTTRAVKADTRIGRNCFIGTRSIILPGVTIGDGCVVDAGSVVNKDVPEGSAVAGNPAKIIRQDIKTHMSEQLKDQIAER